MYPKFHAGLRNPNYLVEIHHHTDNGPGSGGQSANANGSTGGGTSIFAHLPPQINVRTQSDFEPRFASLQESRVINLVRDLSGTAFSLRFLTFQMWQGTLPLQFQMQLLFDAEDSAEGDVMSPTTLLQSWSMPSRSDDGQGFWLHSPGPTPWDESNNRISLRIGRRIYIDTVIIPSCDISYETLTDADGNFIAATADVTFITHITPDRELLKNYYAYGPKSEGYPSLADAKTPDGYKEAPSQSTSF